MPLGLFFRMIKVGLNPSLECYKESQLKGEIGKAPTLGLQQIEA